MKHSCKNCKWHNVREEIKNEIGKNECRGYALICSPVVLGYEIDGENDCEKFEIRGNETLEEIEKQWHIRSSIFERDKSVDLLVNLMAKRERENGGT